MVLLIGGRWEKRLNLASLRTAGPWLPSTLHFDDLVSDEFVADLFLFHAVGHQGLDVGRARLVGIISCICYIERLSSFIVSCALSTSSIHNFLHLYLGKWRLGHALGLRVLQRVVIRSAILHMDGAKLLELLRILMHAHII